VTPLFVALWSIVVREVRLFGYLTILGIPRHAATTARDRMMSGPITSPRMANGICFAKPCFLLTVLQSGVTLQATSTTFSGVCEVANTATSSHTALFLSSVAIAGDYVRISKQPTK
jgi:hypothetical protein